MSNLALNSRSKRQQFEFQGRSTSNLNVQRLKKTIKINLLQRDLVLFADLTKAHVIRRIFFCFTVFFCFALTLFYGSNLVHYNPQDGYGSVFGALGTFGAIKEQFRCERSDPLTDVCHLSGDVRVTTGEARFVTLYSRSKERKLAAISAVNCSEHVDEVIRPYPRKFDNNTMLNRVEQLDLKCKDAARSAISKARSAFGYNQADSCRANQTHSVPALLISNGGFCGNPYHDFMEVVIPLFIAAQHRKGEVVLLLNEVRPFWIERWKKVLQRVSHYPLVNIQEPLGDYCFSEVTVGLDTHNIDFGLNSTLMPNNETIEDFQQFIRDALNPEEFDVSSEKSGLVNRTILREGRVPKLLIVVRENTRLLVNADDLRKMALELGFDVQVVTLRRDHDLSTVYWWFHSSDVVLAAHGSECAYMTFMRRGTVLIQIVVIGTDWPSRKYYGEPAERELGLHYFGYNIQGNESTLADKYGVTDRVVVDPEYYQEQGWDVGWRIYFEEQSVRPDPEKLREIFVSAKALVSDLPPASVA